MIPISLHKGKRGSYSSTGYQGPGPYQAFFDALGSYMKTIGELFEGIGS